MVNEDILKLIDKYCQDEEAKNGRRGHLGASSIGEECERKIWYRFRWAKKGEFCGRMLRLFKRGHEEEIRVVKYLRGIGFEVDEIDPETGKQWRISFGDGHGGGSCDGVLRVTPELFKNASFPPEFNPEDGILFECKTSADKYFKPLVTYGVQTEKPQHWAQICTYGYAMSLKWVLYLAVNKNNDDIHIEFLPIDWGHGERLIKMAEGIIEHQNPPDRRFVKGHFKCKFCEFKRICHFNDPMEKNCRSCKFAKPIANKAWHCGHWGAEIPKEEIEKGCESWVQLSNQ